MGEVVAPLVPVSEGELQNFHAGVSGILQELFHGGGQKAQILSNDVLFTQGFIHRLEEGDARSGLPHAVAGGGLPIGDGVVGVEPPEVVDAQGVADLELPGDPLQPPAVVVLHHLFPVEQGVAPQLAVLREAVGGTARHFGGLSVLVQLKLVRVGPHVRAVQGHIDGQIADDGDTFFVDIFLQAPPLAEKEMLHPLPKVDLSRQFLFHLFQSGGLPQTQLLRPLQPRGSAEFVFQRHKQGIVLQPVRPPEGAPHLEFIPPRQPGDRQTKHLKAVLIEDCVIHLRRVAPPVQRLIFLRL